MKVKRVQGAGSKAVAGSRQKSEPPRVSFTEVLAEKDYDSQKKALEQALADIDKKGKALVEERTIENLYVYKDMIREFIEEVLEKGLELKERRGFSRSGRTKILRTVSEIDKKLVDLTNIILRREQRELNLLKRVGEIQGLLIDLVL